MFTAILKFRDIVVFLVCAVLLAGCGKNIKGGKTAGLFAPDPYQRLAERISEGRTYLSNTKVAVLPFSYTDKRVSNDGVVISERLLTRIINIKKLEVIERGLLDRVLAELNLQHSGTIDESSIKSIGKIIGVEAVVTGTLTMHRDGQIEINARLIRTESAAVLAAASETIMPEWETTGAASDEARERHAVPAAEIRARPAVPTASLAINAILAPAKRPGCPPGMVAYWNFDETQGATAHDAFGMSNARLINGAAWTSAGKVGGAVQFDGLNDYVNTGNNLDLTSGNFTLMGWIYPTELISDNTLVRDKTVISAFDSNGNRGYLFLIRNGVLVYNSKSAGLGTVGAVSSDRWQHVAVTVTGVVDGTSNYTLYLDGAIVGSGNKPSFVAVQPTVIGAYQPHTFGVSYFKGSMDELAIYNRVLSANEIAGLYKKGLAGKNYCSRR